MAVEEHLRPRPSLLQQLPQTEVDEDGEYNPDPNKRRLYWLQKAYGAINQVIDLALRELGQFPEKFRAAYSSEFDVNTLSSPEYFPSFQKDMVKYWIEAAHKIGRKKGFRWGGNLLTAHEHHEIGSTIYVGFDQYPDIPVGVAHHRVMAAEGVTLKGESYTIEEADKGRRLGGRTRLDLATGRVTDELDPEAAKNSYIFLPPDQVSQVKLREQILQETVEAAIPGAMAEHRRTFQLLTDLERYMFGEMTTPEFNARYAVAFTRYPERNQLDLGSSIEEGRRIAFETGCWDFILTPQEIMLRTRAEVDERYKAFPYTPLAIQDGASRQEIAHLRRGEKFMYVTTGILEFEMPMAFRLEGFIGGRNARTIKSPTFVDRHNPDNSVESDRFREYFADKINFPFPRPKDWFYRS